MTHSPILATPRATGSSDDYRRTLRPTDGYPARDMVIRNERQPVSQSRVGRVASGRQLPGSDQMYRSKRWSWLGDGTGVGPESRPKTSHARTPAATMARSVRMMMVTCPEQVAVDDMGANPVRPG